MLSKEAKESIKDLFVDPFGLLICKFSAKTLISIFFVIQILKIYELDYKDFLLIPKQLWPSFVITTMGIFIFYFTLFSQSFFLKIKNKISKYLKNDANFKSHQESLIEIIKDDKLDEETIFNFIKRLLKAYERILEFVLFSSFFIWILYVIYRFIVYMYISL